MLIKTGTPYEESILAAIKAKYKVNMITFRRQYCVNVQDCYINVRYLDMDTVELQYLPNTNKILI